MNHPERHCSPTPTLHTQVLSLTFEHITWYWYWTFYFFKSYQPGIGIGFLKKPSCQPDPGINVEA
jgi:hypothetical protein